MCFGVDNWQLQLSHFHSQWVTCLLFSPTSLIMCWMSSSSFCFLFFKNVSCPPPSTPPVMNSAVTNLLYYQFYSLIILTCQACKISLVEFTSSCPFIVATFLFLSFPSFPPPPPFLIGLGVSLLRITTMTMRRCRWVFLPGCYNTMLPFYKQRRDTKSMLMFDCGSSTTSGLLILLAPVVTLTVNMF